MAAALARIATTKAKAYTVTILNDIARWANEGRFDADRIEAMRSALELMGVDWKGLQVKPATPTDLVKKRFGDMLALERARRLAYLGPTDSRTSAPKWLTMARDLFLSLATKNTALESAVNHSWLQPILKDELRLRETIQVVNLVMSSQRFAIEHRNAGSFLVIREQQPTPIVPINKASEPVATAQPAGTPVELTPAARKAALAAMEAFYPDIDVGYLTGHNDETVATALQLPVATVAELREQFRGPIIGKPLQALIDAETDLSAFKIERARILDELKDREARLKNAVTEKAAAIGKAHLDAYYAAVLKIG